MDSLHICSLTSFVAWKIQEINESLGKDALKMSEKVIIDELEKKNQDKRPDCEGTRKTGCVAL